MASDTIEFDLACIRCEYNLRGIPAGATCPECGHRVLDTIAEHLRRRAPLRAEHARLIDRPPATLRSIRDAGLYAIVANVVAALWLFVQPWMLQRRSPGRYVLLALLCIAIACAAMSIWRLAVPPHRPSRWGTVARWLIRVGAVASLLFVAHTTFLSDSRTFGRYGELWPGMTDRYATTALAWALAIGVTLRLAYAQWWLRLEGRSLVAWPLMLAALPTIFWFLVVEPFGRFYRGDFVSLEFFAELPLVSHAWPNFYYEGRRDLLRLDFWSVMLFAFLAVGQLVVIVADATLARLASRALRTRPA